jgi:hypothetical protein
MLALLRERRKEDAMELFVHDRSGEDPQLLEIDATAVVRTLVAEEGPDGAVWLEEIDEEIELGITMEQAGIHHHHHVHRGNCRRVEVTVRFNGPFERAFGPPATIKRVYSWASGPDGARLSPEQAAKHVLAVPGADHFLDSGVHIGSLVSHGSCSVTLDLLPRERFEG